MSIEEQRVLERRGCVPFPALCQQRIGAGVTLVARPIKLFLLFLSICTQWKRSLVTIVEDENSWDCSWEVPRIGNQERLSVGDVCNRASPPEGQ